MVVYPRDVFEKLEFTKVLAILKKNCLGVPGQNYFDVIDILDDKKAIRNLLSETDEWKKSIERSEAPPIGNYDAIEPDVYLLRKEDYVLDVDAIQRIHRHIFLGQQLITFFRDLNRQKSMPFLTKIVLEVALDEGMLRQIEKVFDVDGAVKPNASDALAKISKSIQNREREVEKVFRQELIHYREQGALVENMESIRNGRLVLMVAAEHKRRVIGIIHDESTSGKTVFIEPEKTIILNNDIYNLYSERRAEIYRIIRELCRFLRPFADQILDAAIMVYKMDSIRAKARFAIDHMAGIPKVTGKPVMNLKEAFNPLLFTRLQEMGGVVVPFDLELLAGNRFLILSGPNAGGKSVALKTIGLLQLMLQAGIPVTADENSEFGIYKKIFVDIGDQQSLEDDLSTYSSHLKNMKKVVEEADSDSLVLIDEFGSGTDPRIGGAIAEAILKELGAKKCYGCITTHYGNLKYFAYKNKGFVNASMEFNKAMLSPTFQLRVGRPGSSFAFEIASKIGLSSDITEYARTKAGQNENAIEDMLLDLQTERKEYFDKMSTVLEKEERIDRLIKTYEQLHGELEYQKRKLKIDQKEIITSKTSESVRELQNMIKDLRRTANVSKAETLLKNEKEKLTEAVEEVTSLKEEAYEKIKNSPKQIKIGWTRQRVSFLSVCPP